MTTSYDGTNGNFESQTNAAVLLAVLVINLLTCQRYLLSTESISRGSILR